MNSKFNRRDFLKLAGALPLGFFSSKVAKSLRLRSDQRKNIIIIVFDAFSAYNIPFHGYSRDTTPNISKLAERATVYHNHYAGSNFTSPGTASLLTGAYPWTHRAMLPNGTVSEKFIQRNIFSTLKDHYHVAYSHNEWVNTFFSQFADYIDEWLPKSRLFLRSSNMVIQSLFKKDSDVSTVAWGRNINLSDGYAYSLFLSRFISTFDRKNKSEYKSRFPRGIPVSDVDLDDGFILEHAIDWIGERVKSIDEPFLGYFHLLPPHSPYNTEKKFAGDFRNDGYKAIAKPLDEFATEGGLDLSFRRAYYDEFILYVDSEFGRLFKMMEDAGVLENSWVILTSDHGEMFERGISGHMTNALYQPVIRIPLMIFEPGQTAHKDIYTPTSAVDILPTLAFWNGLPIPDWAEGKVLPPYQPADSTDRSLYALRSYTTEKNSPLKQASVALMKGHYKLHYYFDYSELNGKDLVKLYDIESDPEEMNDLAVSQSDIANELLLELKAKLADVNKPYA